MGAGQGGESNNFVPLHIGHSETPECSVHYPYRSYSHENNGYDKSIDRSVRINQPSSLLIEELDLKLNFETLEYQDTDGVRAFYDPGLRYESQSSVVVDKEMISFWLKQNDYVVLTKITVLRDYSQGQDGTFMGEITDCQLIAYDGENHSGLRWSTLTEMGPTDSVLRKPFKI